MIVTPIKTEAITPEKQRDLTSILDTFLVSLEEKSILVITSKIVSICEGSVVPISQAQKSDLIKQQSSLYIPPEQSKYNITLTVKDNTLIPTAGIDESNGNGYYILWPKDSHQTTIQVWEYLKKKFSLKEVGVIITDSKTTPLRRGTTGISLGFCGFSSLNNYINTPDIFGRNLHVTMANIADGLAASAVMVMGEGNEQTPLAIIKDVPFVQFVSTPPSREELKENNIPLSEDLYAPLLEAVPWQKGEK